jgi:hypothetical protein
MAGLIQQLTDITLTATPSVGSYLLSIDLDGVLKYKTDAGTISPVGLGATFALIQENLISGLSFLPASGLTHSEFFGPSGSILEIQNSGAFTQTNLNTNFKFLNLETDPIGFGQPFIGVYGETASGSIQFFNGSVLNGSIIGHFDVVKSEASLLLQDNLGFDMSYSDTSNNYGSIISIATSSVSIETQDVTSQLASSILVTTQGLVLEQSNNASNLNNSIILTDPHIKILLATQSAFKVKYYDDPFGSPYEYNLFEIGHNGDFRLSNNKSTGTVSLMSGSASVINSLVTPHSIILTTKQNSNSTYSIASVEQFGGSFSIYSSDPTDTSTVGYFIINTI